MKRILILSLTFLMTTGCATYRDSGSGLGMLTGAVVGSHLGGGTGNVIATAVGAAVGSNVGANIGEHLDSHNRPTNGIYPHFRGSMTYASPNYSVCRDYHRWSERESCRRGVDRAFRNAMERRKRDAYSAGYRSNQGYYD